jgi:hypothetical protein
MPAVPQHLPVRLTQAQRRVIAEVIPELAGRLKLGERNQRTIQFTLAELQAIQEKAGAAVRHALTAREENALRRVLDTATHVIEHHLGTGSNPAPERLYRFRITLLGTRPPVWRRIQVKDCTLDKLHEHVQAAMGWTNSHLHHFKVGEQLYGDPLLMQENFAEMGYEDSTATRLSDILPKSGRRFRFEYAAAERAGFGNHETYRQAAGVVESGTARLIQAMDEGRVSIAAASILAGADAEEQEAVLELDEKAILQAAKEIRQRQAERRAQHQDAKTPRPQARPRKERLWATRLIHGDCRHELKKLAGQSIRPRSSATWRPS